ncbi:MAG: sodium/proline symporter PutP [Oscillospiraceae bacterium]
MSTAQIIMLATVIGYLIFMLIVGFVCSKKNNSVSDFYLGGRKLGPLVTAMSAEASDMSGWLLMGLPGVAYLTGICDAGWTAIGLAIGTYVNWLIVAKRLRNYTEKNGSITIPDFFTNRWKDEKKLLMGISAVIILIFFIPYTGSGFAACGKLFSSLFGIDYHVAMIISAVVIVSYTCFGGFLAASHTDLIQSIVMTIALIVVMLMGVSYAGGWANVADNAKALPGFLSMTSLHNAETNSADGYNIIKIISTAAWGLGYFGMPHVLLRFMAIRDSKEIKLSRRIASVWVVISMFVAILIGIIGSGITANGKLESLADPETIVIKISEMMSRNGVFLAIIAGLIISGILACTMSTSDSQLLAASSSASENIIRGMFGVKLSDKAAMIIARATLLVIAAVGIIVAWNPESSVFTIVSFAWAGFGAAFGPVVLTALFWKRSNKYGALAGLVTGGVVVFVWKYLVRPLGGAWDIYELLPAFIAALIAIIVVSLLTPAPEKEITDEFEAVMSME